MIRRPFLNAQRQEWGGGHTLRLSEAIHARIEPLIPFSLPKGSSEPWIRCSFMVVIYIVFENWGSECFKEEALGEPATHSTYKCLSNIILKVNDYW